MTRLPITFFILLLIGLSSCLEITEQVRMRENGSGQFTFTVDMSEAKPLLEMAQSFGSDTKAEDVNSDLKTGMEDAHTRLQSLKGVHNPALIRSKDGLLSGVTFEFDNIDALNKAVNAVHKNKAEAQEKYFSWNGTQLHRLNTLKLENEIKSKSDSGLLSGLDLTVNGKSMKELAKGMVYRTEYTFDKPVKAISNSSATISPDKRKVVLERYLLDDTRQASTLENVIKL